MLLLFRRSSDDPETGRQRRIGSLVRNWAASGRSAFGSFYRKGVIPLPTLLRTLESIGSQIVYKHQLSAKLSKFDLTYSAFRVVNPFDHLDLVSC